MARRVTLTVIGAGSSQWMTVLMRDVYLIDEIEGGEIRLVDPRKEHAEAVGDMLRFFNKTRAKDYKVSVVDDRREALSGADFVFTTFSPGSMDSFRNDLEIPIKYGIMQPVSMTVGPCGISASLRTASVAYEIVQDMEDVCPGAWLLNVTNPMSVVTRAMNLAARTVKVIGMCHETHGLPGVIERIFGVKKPEGMSWLDFMYVGLGEMGVEYTLAGVNHCCWLTKLRINGEDSIPRVRQFAEEMCSSGGASADSAFWVRIGAAKLALCKTFGYLPIAGDRHLVEFWPSLCNVRNGYGRAYNVDKTTVDLRRHNVEKNLAQIRRITAGEEAVNWESENLEETADIMRAILNKTSRLAMVNMPNRGQITNMQPDVVVETLGTVDCNGVTPKPSGALPGAVGSLMRLHADVHDLTLRASLEGSRDLLVQALSLDPLSAQADFAEIGKLADDLLRANKRWLPRFFPS